MAHTAAPAYVNQQMTATRKTASLRKSPGGTPGWVQGATCDEVTRQHLYLQSRHDRLPVNYCRHVAPEIRPPSS